MALTQNDYSKASQRRIRAEARAFRFLRESALLAQEYDFVKRLDDAFAHEYAKCTPAN